MSNKVKILFAHGLTTEAIGRYWQEALKEVADVTTLGPSSDFALSQDIKTGPAPDITQIVGDGRDFDYFVWCLSPYPFFPQRIHKLKIPTIALISAALARYEILIEALKIFDAVVVEKYLPYRYFRNKHQIYHLYMPAFDIKKLRFAEEEMCYDITFCGNYFPYLYTERGKILKALSSLAQDYNVFIGGAYLGEDYYKIIGRSKVVVHAPFDPAEGLTTHLFEALGLGKVFLTTKFDDDNPRKFFKENIHFLTFGDKDYRRRMEEVIKNWPKYKKIGKAGQCEVLKSHTYFHRAKEFLDILNRVKKIERKVDLSAYGRMFFHLGIFKKSLLYLFEKNEIAPALASAGYLNEALKYFERAMNDKIDFMSWGNLLTLMGDKKKAKEVYQKGIESKVRDVLNCSLYYPNGWTYEKVKRIKTAIKIFKGFKNAKEEFEREMNGVLLCKIAKINLEKNEVDEAERCVNLAEQLSECYDAHFLKGILSLKKNKVKDALQNFIKVKEKDAILPYVSIYISDCYEKIKKEEESIEALKEGFNELQILNAISVKNYEPLILLFLRRFKEKGIAVNKTNFIKAGKGNVEEKFSFKLPVYKKVQDKSVLKC